MRTLATPFVFLVAGPAMSATSCPPSQWILANERGENFSVVSYGAGISQRYTAVALRGRVANDTYYITNEYPPQATGGPWSSSKSLPKFVWAHRAVPLRWGEPQQLDNVSPDLSVFEGPLKGEWTLKRCRS